MAQTALVPFAPNALLPTGLTSASSIEAYTAYAHSVPMLTEEEELECATRLRLYNDLQAAQRLILAHLRFVIKIARGFSGYGLAQADLIQEGNIGLMKAVKRFDPKVGVRLVSFAVHWIKAEIHEFIIKNWRIVKIATTKAQRKLFFNLRNCKKRLGWLNQEEVESVAKDLNVKPEEVLEMEKRLNAYDAAFDAPAANDEEDVYSPSYFLTSSDEDPEKALEQSDWEGHCYDNLYNALDQLDDRSRDIVATRWLADKKATLHELAAKYNVSAERIRQLEAQAIKQLKGAIAA